MAYPQISHKALTLWHLSIASTTIHHAHTPLTRSVRRTRGTPGLREMVVITLDDRLAAVLPPHVQAVPLLPLVREIDLDLSVWTTKYFLPFLWASRVRLVATLLDRGVNVLMNDLDAVWIQDPNKEMFRQLPPNTDIIAQRGNMPSELGFRFGKNDGKWGRCDGSSQDIGSNALSVPTLETLGGRVSRSLEFIFQGGGADLHQLTAIARVTCIGDG